MLDLCMGFWVKKVKNQVCKTPVTVTGIEKAGCMAELGPWVSSWFPLDTGSKVFFFLDPVQRVNFLVSDLVER